MNCMHIYFNFQGMTIYCTKMLEGINILRRENPSVSLHCIINVFRESPTNEAVSAARVVMS